MSAHMKRLAGKTAFVTGAGSGIGREIALAFAREGAAVGVADLSTTGADETVGSIAAEGGRALTLTVDVTDETRVDAAVAQCIAELGGLDILVSNAGIQHIEAIDQLSYDAWRKLIAVHLDAAFLTTRAALRHMYEHGGGSIIYMGSVHSKEASVLKAPYVTAKHGLIGLAKTVAKEGAPHNVRANVICPGYVYTALVEKQIPQQARERGISPDEVVKTVMLKDTVDGEFTTVADVAEVAVFFAAFPTNALTGQSIVVSHGWHME